MKRPMDGYAMTTMLLEAKLRFAEEEKEQAVALAYEQGKEDGRAEALAPIQEHSVEDLLKILSPSQIRGIAVEFHESCIIEDVLWLFEDNRFDIEFSDSEAEAIAKEVAKQAVINGEMDSNLSHWDNLENLVKNTRLYREAFDVRPVFAPDVTEWVAGNNTGIER